MGKRGKAPKYNDVFCTNHACSLYGKTEQGNIVSNGTYSTKSGRVRKFICRNCGNIFNGRSGTVFFDLRTSEEKVIMALKLLLKGMSGWPEGLVRDCQQNRYATAHYRQAASWFKKSAAPVSNLINLKGCGGIRVLSPTNQTRVRLCTVGACTPS